MVSSILMPGAGRKRRSDELAFDSAVTDDLKRASPMKLLIASVALIGIGSNALAQSHPLTLRMTCYGARELVSVHGTIVLNTSPTTYDRYVAAGGQCVLGEVIEPAWVLTADNPQCPIGYRCVTRMRPSHG